MAVEFRLATHTGRNVGIVEILVEGHVVGVIYPNGEKAVRLVSAHVGSQAVDKEFAGTVLMDDGSSVWPPIPSVEIEFAPSPYVIGKDRIIKLDQ